MQVAAALAAGSVGGHGRAGAGLHSALDDCMPLRAPACPPVLTQVLAMRHSALDKAAEARDNLKAHIKAMQDIKADEAMRDVMTATLALGNFLNHGTQRGASAGGCQAAAQHHGCHACAMASMHTLLTGWAPPVCCVGLVSLGQSWAAARAWSPASLESGQCWPVVAGFRVSTLNKLADSKSTDNKVTLLQIVAAEVSGRGGCSQCGECHCSR